MRVLLLMTPLRNICLFQNFGGKWLNLFQVEAGVKRTLKPNLVMLKMEEAGPYETSEQTRYNDSKVYCILVLFSLFHFGRSKKSRRKIVPTVTVQMSPNCVF